MFKDSDLLISPTELVRDLTDRINILWREHPGGDNKPWTDAVKVHLHEIAGTLSKPEQQLKVEAIYTHSEPGMREFLLDVVWCKLHRRALPNAESR